MMEFAAMQRLLKAVPTQPGATTANVELGMNLEGQDQTGVKVSDFDIDSNEVTC